MADTTYVTIPELTEITRAETTDTAMLETAVEDQLTPTGYGSRRITLSSIASYVLSNFSSLSLGGVTRTVKAAIDAIATLLGSSSMGTTATTVTGAIAEHEGDITTLTNSVNDLNSHLGYSGINIITLQNATAGANASYYYKSGKAVTLFLDLTPSASASSLTVATLPSGYTPPTSIRTTPSPVNDDSSNMGTNFVVVNMSGDIQIYMTNAKRVFVQMTFAVA